MGTPSTPRPAFLRTLRRAAPRAIRALAEELAIPRSAAAEALGAAAGLGLAGLARHQRKRADDPRAAADVVRKYGRPADLEAPDVGIRAHLSRPQLSPRLGGLLGDTGPRAAAWLSGRTPGTTPEAAGRALAASTPLVLGAIGDAPTEALTAWIAGVPEAPLDDPAALVSGAGEAGQAFRAMRRLGLPWWRRALRTPWDR